MSVALGKNKNFVRSGEFEKFETQGQIQARLGGESADMISTAVFGGAVIIAAAPVLAAAAPTISNAASYGLKTYGRDFLINTAKQYFSNQGDAKKIDWFDVGVSTLNPFKKLGMFSGAANETLSSMVDIKNNNIQVVGLNKKGSDFLIDFGMGQIKSLGKTTFSTLGG